MGYQKELDFIVKAMRQGFKKCFSRPTDIENKTSFDLVTDVDKSIEKYLTEQIKLTFPDDTILGEEFSSKQILEQRTWTIDPIDGTCNMANGMQLFGMQCALIADGRIVLGAIYLPFLNEMLWAEQGKGSFCNSQPISVNSAVTLNNAIVSFGDYPHKETSKVANIQHQAISRIFSRIAKIRMFGAACMDFSMVAQGKTHGTVVTTTNLWDIAPGIIICQEAGALVRNLRGEDYKIGDEGVVVCANQSVAELLASAYHRGMTLKINEKEYHFTDCIFDFDGVILDTEKYHYQAWDKALSDFGLALSEEQYLPLRSTGRENIIDSVAAMHGRVLSDEQKFKISALKDQAFADAIKNISDDDLIPGALEFVTLLNSRNVKTAVASSSKSVGKFMDQFHMQGMFDCVLDGFWTCPKKPAPDIFLQASSKLFSESGDCLVFEDSAVGVEAAVAAGMSVIAIGGLKSDKALACFDDFSHLLSLVQ